MSLSNTVIAFVLSMHYFIYFIFNFLKALFINLVPGAEKTLDGIPISSFSYIDLVEGYIKYIQISHQGVEPENDAVYIRITDGHLSSPTYRVNITIKPIDDEIPHILTQPLFVLQGSFAKVLNSTLAVFDGDTSSDQLHISLDNSPQKGINVFLIFVQILFRRIKLNFVLCIILWN